MSSISGTTSYPRSATSLPLQSTTSYLSSSTKPQPSFLGMTSPATSTSSSTSSSSASTSAPVSPSPTSSFSTYSKTQALGSTVTYTPSACFGNQVLGSCTQANRPDTTANAESQYPVCNKINSKNNYFVRFNETFASQHASYLYKRLVLDGVVLAAAAAIQYTRDRWELQILVTMLASR